MLKQLPLMATKYYAVKLAMMLKSCMGPAADKPTILNLLFWCGFLAIAANNY